MTWFEHLVVAVEKRDLLSMPVDAIVCPLTVRLEAYGRISQALVQRTNGTVIQAFQQARSKLPGQALPLGGALSLPCRDEYGLDVKRIILVAIWDRESPYSPNLFYTAYISALREANRCSLRTVAMPIMGYDGSIVTACNAFVRVVTEMNGLRTSTTYSVGEIYLVSTNTGHCRVLQDILNRNLPSVSG